MSVVLPIDRLEERGMLSSTRGEATPVRGGRAKRCFAIQPQGREALATSVSTLRQLLTGTEFALS